jgi:hypothetical protein
MCKTAVALIASTFVLLAASLHAPAAEPGPGSAVIKVDLPTKVVAGEYEMESLVEGSPRAVKQVDTLKLDVKEQKIAGKYLATQSGNGMNSKFNGEWEAGNTPILILNQDAPEKYRVYYVLQASAKDTFTGTWVDNQDHHGSAKLTLKKAE